MVGPVDPGHDGQPQFLPVAAVACVRGCVKCRSTTKLALYERSEASQVTIATSFGVMDTEATTSTPPGGSEPDTSKPNSSAETATRYTHADTIPHGERLDASPAGSDVTAFGEVISR